VIILALDLATATGFAFGGDGACPVSGTVILKKPPEPQDVAFGNMQAWLTEKLESVRPVLIVKEAHLPLQGFRDRFNSQKSVEMALGLNGVVRGIAHRFGVPVEDIHPATVRKHFLGVGRVGNREETKAAVVKRCHMLKLMPATCFSHDRADALAIFSWAAATYGRRAPRELVMFGES
jgi:Holliday junction resolvasome RuvABC endonuclease subunit